MHGHVHSDPGPCGASELAGEKRGGGELHSQHRPQIRRAAVVVGTSIGGAVALDFALTHPEDVAALVLIDAQGFIDGASRPLSRRSSPPSALLPHRHLLTAYIQFGLHAGRSGPAAD